MSAEGTATSASAADVLGLVGTTVEQIRFDSCVDANGFGVVYRGQHVGNDEPVAIKCIRLSHLSNVSGDVRRTIAARFRDEAKVIQRLSHGNHDIVRCISSGELYAPATGEQVPFMVLEWLEGRTLAADLEERQQKGQRGRMLPDALDLMESAALAIAYAHSQNIVHRHIEPSNLMLTRTRGGGVRIKVLDFGLARIISEDPVTGIGLSTTAAVTTLDGAHLVSPSYAAPEQLVTELGKIGPWTDIYSFALILLEVLRGSPIRPATTRIEGLTKAVDPATGSPRASSLGLMLPKGIEDLLARAVAKNPQERPASAGIFWTALRDLARQSVPPVNDAAALAATAFDGGVADAIQRVREATKKKPSSEPAPAPQPVASFVESSPFTGTMLMEGGPGGALHLVPMSSQAPQQQQGESGSTAPLVMPISPNAQTVATPALASPLASSLGPGAKSPAMPGSNPSPNLPQSAPQPGGVSIRSLGADPISGRGSDAYRPTQPAPQHMLQQLNNPRPPSVPPAAPIHVQAPSAVPQPPVKSSMQAIIIGVLSFLVLAVAVTAGIILYRRPSK